jgi:hypothetical protein
MMFLPRIILPRPEIKFEFRQEIGDLYFKWRNAHEAAQPEFKIENVRFRHDPDWRTRAYSATAVRDHPYSRFIYRVTIVGYAAAQLSALLMR